MKIFAVAGEPSGDRILARLLRGLRIRFPELEAVGLGGPLSVAEGLKSGPWDRLAVYGVGDVLRKLPFLIGSYAAMRRRLRRFDPDLVLLVDYPGMNVGLARLAGKLGYGVHYIAPPQLWAYRNPEHRLRHLRKALRRASLQVLFPFERQHYDPWAKRLAVGHFFEILSVTKIRGGRLLLCPGSRRATLRRNLRLWLEKLRAPEFTSTLRSFSGIDLLTPPHLAAEAKILVGDFHPEILTDSSAAWERAEAAIAFPGTITLELFLRRIPTQIWAVLDPLTLRAGKRALRFPWTALPNLILQKSVFPEWVGTAVEFRRSGSGPKAEWKEILEVDVHAVRDKTGLPNGEAVGVASCLELLEPRASKVAE